MARFDVCRINDGGLVLDVQADILDGLRTRVVVPLIDKEQFPNSAKFLNPVFEIDGRPYVLKTEFLAAVDGNSLGEPVTNISASSSVITRALDMVFQGF